jgi:hypothetical protein
MNYTTHIATYISTSIPLTFITNIDSNKQAERSALFITKEELGKNIT